MKHRSRWIVGVLIVAVALLAACNSNAATGEKVEPVQVEPIAGTDLSRVTLTERAAERLGIQTDTVRDQQVERRRAIGGQVVDAEAGVLVRVALNPSDLSKVDRSQLAIVRPVDDDEEDEDEDDDDEATDGWFAELDEGWADDDEEDDGGALYFVVSSEEGDLAPGQRVFVEVATLGGGAEPKVIPYAAVLYDVHGETWVYTRVEPLVFVRAPIIVDYIEGDLAVLLEGPPAGTEVVTDGAAELFGAESGIGGGGH